MAPTKKAPIVLCVGAPDGDPDAAARQLRLAVWGQRPKWIKDVKKRGLTNARAESVDEKPSFRTAFAQRRCIVPADGFYEWFTESPDDGGKPVKQPYFFRPADGAVLAMAGLLDWWHDPESDLWTPTYSIITTSATDDAGMVHDRMPMIVTADRWEAWLDPAVTDPIEARSLMTAPLNGVLDIYPVSKAVGSVRNNGPQLVESIAV